jgi:hypothetical protein
MLEKEENLLFKGEYESFFGMLKFGVAECSRILSNLNPFLLQNHNAGCISIGLIPLPLSTSCQRSDIFSLGSFSSRYITPSFIVHWMTCVSGAIPIQSEFFKFCFPYLWRT